MSNRICFMMTTALAVAAGTLLAGPQREADLAKIKAHYANSGDAPWTWVFYGDSITHGAAHTHGWRSFPEIIQERVRWEYGRVMDTFINSGNSGQSSLNLLDNYQYEWQVRRHRPQIVLLLVGSNDIVRPNCGGPEDFRARLSALVERIRQDGAIPVLQTYPTIQQEHNPTTEYLRGYVKRYNEFPIYNTVIREVSQKYDTICVDHWNHWVENASDPDVLDYWQGETIHPGAQGHQQMAILILKELGMYSPNSRCCSLVAGGPRPKPLKPLKDEDITWFMTYTPATDGVFPAAQWDHTYPEGTAVIKDNLLLLNHMDDATNPMATLKDITPLTNAQTVVTEIDVRYPPQQEELERQGRLYMAIAGEWEGVVSELILVLDDKLITGTIQNLGYDAQPGETVTLRFVLDVPTARVASYCNGVLLGTRKSRQETTVGPRLFLGDAASVVRGFVELRSIRMGTAMSK